MTVVLQERLCGDSGLASEVVWRQWSYTSEVVWRQWSYK